MARSLSSTALAVIIVVIVVVVTIGGYYAYISSRRTVSTTTPTTISTSTTTTSALSSTTTSMTTSTKTTTPTGVTLYVATYTGAPQTLLNLVIPIFEEEHPGVHVQVVALPFTQYIDNELTVLKTGSSSYDIVTFTPTTARVLAPYVVPLNSSIINISDLLWPVESFGGVIYNQTTNQSIIVGVAPWVSNVVIFYNAKYFDNSTLQQEFYQEYHMQLNPWTWHNWTVVIDVSKFFVSHNITKYGVLVMDDPEAGDVLDSFESVYAWYYFQNSTLNCGVLHGIPGFGVEFYGCIPGWWNHPFPPPAINTTAGVEALETLEALVSYLPNPTQFQVSYDNMPELFAEGYGPAAVNYASRLSAILQQNMSPSEVLMAPLPGNYSMAGGTYFAVSRFSVHKQLAFEFLDFIESPQIQALMFLKTGLFPISKGAYRLLLSNTSLPAYEREWLQANMIAAEYANAWEPLNPVTFQLGDALSNAIMSYLQNPTTTSPQQVLQQAAKQYVQILEEYYSSLTSTTTTTTS